MRKKGCDTVIFKVSAALFSLQGLRMFKRGLVIAASALLGLIPGQSAAQTDPWAVSEELQAAAMSWLEADNPDQIKTALWDIGTLAAEGDLAARHLANAISIFFIAQDFAALDRDARRALFPDDPEGSRFSFQPFHLESEAVPAMAARREIQTTETFEDWRKNADVLIGADFDSYMITSLRILMAQEAPFVPNALIYAEPFVAPHEYVWIEIWFYRGFEAIGAHIFGEFDQGKLDRQRDQWGGTSWGPLQTEQLSQALNEGRWSALRTLGMLTVVAREAEIDDLLPDVTPQMQRWADLAAGWDDTQPVATADEFEAIGAFVRADSERSVSLAPLRTACDTSCPDAANGCIGAGILSQQLNSNYLPEFGPALSAQTYGQSARAARDLLRIIAETEAQQPDRFAALPNCLLTAAREATLVE